MTQPNVTNNNKVNYQINNNDHNLISTLNDPLCGSDLRREFICLLRASVNLDKPFGTVCPVFLVTTQKVRARGKSGPRSRNTSVSDVGFYVLQRNYLAGSLGQNVSVVFIPAVSSAFSKLQPFTTDSGW